MVTVKDISEYINSIAPYSTQFEWDNCGIIVGDENKEVKKIGFVLDLTAESLKDAVINGVDLIITHHPVIFRAQKTFLKGNIAFETASEGITVLSAHTCFDCAAGGVNDVLCNILGINNAVGVQSESCSVPMARMGYTDKMTSTAFAEYVRNRLNTPCRIIDCGNTIERVAVCGGAGAEFLDDVARMGADAYVTGEMDYHELLRAAELGITTILAGHYETENPSMIVLKDIVCNKFSGLQGVVLKQINPVKYIF